MSYNSSYAGRAAQPALLFLCGNISANYLQLRDAVAWETFDESALSQYVITGIQSMQFQIQKLLDFSHEIQEDQVKELFFMLESLLYVRSLLVESSAISMGEVTE
ncbi:MAG: hypothetical protein ABIQ91_01535 [Candidatus Paceibacterota bacterium]